MKKLTPKSCGHKTVPLDHFQRYKIILESMDTILYPHANLYPTLSPFTALSWAITAHRSGSLKILSVDWNNHTVDCAYAMRWGNLYGGHLAAHRQIGPAVKRNSYLVAHPTNPK